jgi:HlyD family secretion protein
MKRFLRIAIIGAVVVAVALGLYMRFRPTAADADTTVSTATAEIASLSASVNSAGNIQARQSAALSFGQSGTVEKINVEVGDRVQAGDLLAELDTEELALSLRSAQVGLKNAQAQYAQTANPATASEIANARAKLESAQAAYDSLIAGPNQSELATTRAQVASAQAAYNAAVKSAGTSDSALISAAGTLEKARIALESAQGDYDRISWRGDAAASSQASALQSATIDYEQAKASYDAIAATSETDAQSKVASAVASLRSAQASLDETQEQATAAELASAQATLTQAKNDLDDLLAGADANELDIAQNQVEQAQIALDQAELKMAQTRILAPFDGIITAVAINVGQSASGTAIEIADLDNLKIVVSMSEVDINSVAEGQAAEVTLDAVPDVTFTGTVTQIAPAGVQSSGVVNYPVTVALNDPDETVKTGMTANVNIIIDHRENVLTVPNRAVKTVNRRKVVTVLFEGQQIQVPVEVGMSSDSLTEIVSGLKEGDTVLLTTTSTSTTSGRGPGGMMIIEGGPPPGM